MVPFLTQKKEDKNADHANYSNTISKPFFLFEKVFLSKESPTKTPYKQLPLQIIKVVALHTQFMYSLNDNIYHNFKRKTRARLE